MFRERWGGHCGWSWLSGEKLWVMRSETILVERIYLNMKQSGSVSCSVAALRTVAYQTPLSIEFSRQEFWSRLPLPSPGDLPDTGIKPSLPHYRWILYQLSYQGHPALSNFKVDLIHFCFLTWLPLRQYCRDHFDWDRKQLEAYFGGSDSSNHWLPGTPYHWRGFELRRDMIWLML